MTNSPEPAPRPRKSALGQILERIQARKRGAVKQGKSKRPRRVYSTNGETEPKR